ncbi:UNVERIFIED_CONTAM: hypothetical protein NY100_01800 [Prevotella sp. 15_C9]
MKCHGENGYRTLLLVPRVNFISQSPSLKVKFANNLLSTLLINLSTGCKKQLYSYSNNRMNAEGYYRSFNNIVKKGDTMVVIFLTFINPHLSLGFLDVAWH